MNCYFLVKLICGGAIIKRQTFRYLVGYLAVRFTKSVTGELEEYKAKYIQRSNTADHGGFKFIAYVLTIFWHIYSSLINMRSVHILPHI
jgi:hypothetical protein